MGCEHNLQRKSHRNVGAVEVCENSYCEFQFWGQTGDVDIVFYMSLVIKLNNTVKLE